MNMDILVKSIVGIGGILLAGVLFLVAFKWRRGKWLRLMAGNIFGDVPEEEAKKTAGKCSVLINTSGVFVLLLTLSIVFSWEDSRLTLALLGLFLAFSLYHLVVGLKEWVKNG